LRFVLSVPPNDNGISLASDLSLYFHKGILQSIQQAGGYSKSEKKMIYGQKRILSVIAHPVAIAHAHGLLDNELNRKQNVLIVDWGASAMSVSHLVIVGGIVRIVNHVWDDSLSGKHIISLLVKHIAELFERKNRCIPPGEVLCNKKARAKLEIAAEEAIRSLGFSSKVTVTIDGLYEGLDCHVDVMLATFEMLMKSILTRSEVMLKGFQEEGEKDGIDDDVKNYDAVIGAGSVMNIKCVERMMDRIFPREIFYRGKSVNDVPPEEAVAMGCAVYGTCCLSTGFLDDMQGDEKSNNPEETVQQWSLVDEEVPLCPIGIGLRLVEGNPAAILLIEEGMPLPCLVTKMISVSECTSKCIDIVQITSPSSEKTIGRIQGVEGDDENKQLEITVEVDESGILSFAINGLVTDWDEFGSSTVSCSE
jgi:molecular chaperone DnaK (HSP70)